MSKSEFTAFLALTLSNAAGVAKGSAIAFVCMDWRHMREILDAGEAAFTELKNLCIWNKTNGGMGSFNSGGENDSPWPRRDPVSRAFRSFATLGA